jgi:predicted MFS family arabinose efflux permease
MERIGMRRMMVGSLIFLAIGVVLTTFMHAAWQLYLLWGVVVGLGTGAITGWVAATVANRWFYERRGLVVGLLTASSATGQLLFLPILAKLAVTVGWRSAVLLVVSVTLLVIPLVALFIRNFPQDVGLQPYGAPDVTPSLLSNRPTTAGNPFEVALKALFEGARSRDFLLLAGSFFICGASTNGLIGTHLIPASVEHGIPEVTAASLLAVIGVFDIFGTMFSGWLSDRFDSRWLLCWYYSLRGLSLLFLPYAYGTGFFGLGAFVVFYGLDWVATVPPTVRITADRFGKQNVGTYYSWIFAAHQLGAATAAFGAGALRTWLGDYQASFMTAGVLCLLAAGLVIRIGHSARGELVPVQSPSV